MYLSARGKMILVIHHSHNTATQFIFEYTQGLLFVFLNYLKFTFQYKYRSPLQSMKTRLWTENQTFLKQFQYRCLSEANFKLRGNSPWAAVLGSDDFLSNKNINVPQNLSVKSLLLKLFAWRPAGQRWQPSPEIPVMLPEAVVLFPLCYSTAKCTSMLISI